MSPQSRGFRGLAALDPGHPKVRIDEPISGRAQSRELRARRLAGEPVGDQELRKNVLVCFGLILAICTASWLFTITVEPDETWTDYGHQKEHKLIDAASCAAATLNNIGPGLGVIGATKNYADFQW